MQTASVGSATGTQANAATRGLNGLRSEDFYRILVTELQQQDPLQPTDTSDLISQVSGIRSIELSSQLSSSLDALANQQRSAGAAELIGKFVSASVVDGTGQTTAISGVVTGVLFDSQGAAILELDTGQVVPFASVQWITTLDEVERRTAAANQLDPTETDKTAASARRTAAAAA